MCCAKRVLIFFCTINCFLLLWLPNSSSTTPPSEHSLVVAPSAVLQLPHGLMVKDSPGSKPGASVLCERVQIRGFSRIRNLTKYAHLVIVKVSRANSSVYLPNAEEHYVEFRNVSRRPVGETFRRFRGSFHVTFRPQAVRYSDNRFLLGNIREFLPHHVIFLVLGIVMMILASFLSKSLVFYYGGGMASGIILVVLFVLYKGTKRWANLLSIFLRFLVSFWSTIAGVAYFIFKLFKSCPSTLQEIGIPQEMYQPAVTFLLAFVILVGAGLGFCMVRKLALTQDGSIDTSTSYFVAWSIRVFASLLILQSSADPVMATEALMFVIMASSVCSGNIRSCLIHRFNRNWKKSAKRRHEKTPPFEDCLDEHGYNIRSHEDSELIWRKYKNFNTTGNGFGGNQLFVSSFHTKATRRRFSRNDWENFTRDSTNSALEELVSSPSFGKWFLENADRITVSPRTTLELNSDISGPYDFTHNL